jgi:Domain of unknown function (DUF222)
MDSNTHSTRRPTGWPDGLAGLAAAVDDLAAQELDRLTDAALAEQVLGLRRLLDRLEGHWLQQLATVDGRGAAGAEAGAEAGSTASWLRSRLRMGAGAAAGCVRTARALFRGPLAATATALTAGELSVAHASVLASGTQELPEQVTVEAEPVLVEAAGRLDPPRLRRVLGHLQHVADPQGADDRAERRHARRGLWLAPTWEGMVAIDGLLDPEAGHTLLAALEPLTQPASADDPRSGAQRRADALTELARRSLEAGRLPRSGGVRPQLTVTVELDSLVGRPGGVGGAVGWAGPLAPETCRRLACDGALTRVLVTRHPTSHHPDQGPSGHHHGHGLGADTGPLVQVPSEPEEGVATRDLIERKGLEARLRAAVTKLPPTLGGAPSQPLEVGRASRVVQAAQRSALAVRDGGCVFPGCARPLGWCEHPMERKSRTSLRVDGRGGSARRVVHRSSEPGVWWLLWAVPWPVSPALPSVQPGLAQHPVSELGGRGAGLLMLTRGVVPKAQASSPRPLVGSPQAAGAVTSLAARGSCWPAAMAACQATGLVTTTHSHLSRAAASAVRAWAG